MSVWTMITMLVLVGILTVSLFGHSVHGLKCYKCASERGGHCESPSQADGVVIEFDYCTGSCMNYKTDDGYHRECSFVRHAEECRSGSFQGVDAEVCACNTDLCNNSVKLRPSVLTFISVALLLFIFKYFK